MLDKNKFYQLFGKQIQHFRLESAEFSTLELLSSEIGLTKASLSAIENGKQTVSAYQLYRISQALNIPVEKFFHNIEFSESSKLLDGDFDFVKKL